MLSEVLRSHRERRGWSIRELARRSGLSPSALSKVERGELSMTYDKLQQLAHGLDIDMAELFQPAEPPTGTGNLSRRSVVFGADDEVIGTKNYLYHYLHTDLTNKAFLPIFARVVAKNLDEFGPLLSHDGEEFSYVTRGTILFVSAHYKPVELKQGDSVYFDSAMGHAYLNNGEGPAEIMCISSASRIPSAD